MVFEWLPALQLELWFRVLPRVCRRWRELLRQTPLLYLDKFGQLRENVLSVMRLEDFHIIDGDGLDFTILFSKKWCYLARYGSVHARRSNMLIDVFLDVIEKRYGVGRIMMNELLKTRSEVVEQWDVEMKSREASIYAAMTTMSLSNDFTKMFYLSMLCCAIMLFPVPFSLLGLLSKSTNAWLAWFSLYFFVPAHFYFIFYAKMEERYWLHCNLTLRFDRVRMRPWWAPLIDITVGWDSRYLWCRGWVRR